MHPAGNESTREVVNGHHRIRPHSLAHARVAGTLACVSLLALALASCGGSSSSSNNDNPVPSIAAISPSSVTAGGAAFTLTVTGTNFISSSVVRWNGADHTTTYQSRTQLAATISSSDIAAAGTAKVTVFNPAPGGGTSGALTFTVTTLTPPVIATKQLPDTAAGKVYDITLAGSGGASPLTWSLASGALSLNLTLDAATGRISGTVTPSAAGSTANFTVRLTDSAATPQTVGQSLSILVRAAGLGSNDSCTAGTTGGTTSISNGRIRASISPYGDIDVYSFQGRAGAQVTIEIFAQRLDLDGDSATRDSYLDSVLDLLDSNCSLLTFNDDIDPGVVQDSLIQNYVLPYSGTYFIRVRDFRGDGRPDLIYELSLSGAN